MASRKTLFATLFAAVMVASMFAPTAGAAAAMDGTGGDAIDVGAADVDSDVQLQTDTTNESADRPARVDPALRSASDETVIVVAVERELDLRAASADGEVSISRIRSDSEATLEPVATELETLGANVRERFWAGNIVTAEVDLSEVDLDRVATIDRVKSVSPNVRYERPEPPAAAGGGAAADASAQPANHEGNYTYGLEQINVPEFEDEFGTQGEGATVMIGDDGISNPEAGHPDLEFAKEAIVQNGTVDEGTLVGGAEGAHGEHTAGTATGAADPAGDVPRYGVAPDADLLMADVFAGGAFTEDIIASMEWAAENDADAASFSLGFPSSTGLSTFQPAYVETIEDVNAAGTVAVVSAGNSGSGNGGGPVTSRATNFRSATVGASNPSESIAAFSSGAVVTDDRIETIGEGDLPDTFPHSYVKPDVAAPGVDVLSAGPLGTAVEDPNATYSLSSGTSMAAPHYAGAVALLQSATDEDLSPGLIKAALAETAEKPSNEFPSADGRDIRYGTGIIDVHAAAQALNETQTIEGTVTDNATGEPVVGATVATEAGSLTTTDENGSYTLQTTEDPATVTVDQFGNVEQTVEVSGGEATDFALESQLAVYLVEGQPQFAATGGNATLVLDVRNLDGLTIELTDDSELNASDLTVSVAGSEVELGNQTTFESLDGDAVPVTVEIAEDAPVDADFSLEHTFVGASEELVVETGPTTTLDEFEGPEFEVTNVDVQEDVTLNEPILISATVENVGDQAGSTQTITAVQDAATGGEENFIFFPPSPVNDLAPGDTQTFETNFGSLAGINAILGTNFGPGDDLEAVQQVGSNLDPTVAPAPNVTDEGTAPFSVVANGTFFEVTDLEAPAEAEAGDQIDVSANVTNAGTEAGEQAVEFVFNDTVAASQNVSLNASETQSVTFANVTVPNVDGTFEHGIFTENDGQTATIDVEGLPSVQFAEEQYVFGPGETRTLLVETDAESVAGYDAQVEFDPEAVTVEGASAGNLSGAFTVNVDNENGTVSVGQAQANGGSPSVLFALEVTYEGEEGGSADLAFDAEDSELLDANTDAIEVGYSGAGIVSGELGDANTDGEVTVADAILVQQSIAGQDLPDDFNRALADVDGDGSLTTTDVLAILDEALADNDGTDSPETADTEVNATDTASVAAP